MTDPQLIAPFQYFGGKRDVALEVWARFGKVKQFGEPFCGSAAVLLAAPEPASLEVIGDMNGFIANFWRAVANQAGEVAKWADYPVSHVDLGARHIWLMAQRERLGAELQDPNWPGDAKVAGWWLWGQVSWIGSGWCDWEKSGPRAAEIDVSNAGQGIQAIGQIPHVGNAGQGIQAIGQIPHVGNAGRGVQAFGKIPHVSDAGDFLTSSGRVADVWLRKLCARLERCRIIHGDWARCLNHHYGGTDTAYFMDPPYDNYEGLYRAGPVAQAVAEWCRANAELKIALCGHRGDYDMPGWTEYLWSRKRNTYSGTGTKDAEVIWFSPACITPSGGSSKQPQLALPL